VEKARFECPECGGWAEYSEGQSDGRDDTYECRKCWCLFGREFLIRYWKGQDALDAWEWLADNRNWALKTMWVPGRGEYWAVCKGYDEEDFQILGEGNTPLEAVNAAMGIE